MEQQDESDPPIRRSEMLELLRDKLSLVIDVQPKNYASGSRVVIKINYDKEVVTEDSFDIGGD